LPLGPRSGQPQGAAVAGAAESLDHGVDTIAVTFGVGESFEHHTRDAVAEGNAVAGAVEAAASPCR
jgi:hypothetical protein